MPRTRPHWLQSITHAPKCQLLGCPSSQSQSLSSHASQSTRCQKWLHKPTACLPLSMQRQWLIGKERTLHLRRTLLVRCGECQLPPTARLDSDHGPKEHSPQTQPSPKLEWRAQGLKGGKAAWEESNDRSVKLRHLQFSPPAVGKCHAHRSTWLTP